jgi:hypothetical protein
MADGLTRRFEARRLGLLAALLALAGQVAFGAVVPRDDTLRAAFAELAAASFICHTDAADQKSPAPHHRAPDGALCLFCQAVAQAGILLAPVPLPFRLPTLQPVHDALPPPSRAPPSRALVAAYPRGPPPLA